MEYFDSTLLDSRLVALRVVSFAVQFLALMAVSEAWLFFVSMSRKIQKLVDGLSSAAISKLHPMQHDLIGLHWVCMSVSR